MKIGQEMINMNNALMAFLEYCLMTTQNYLQ